VQARLMNVVWGVWLVISVFMWPHSDAQFVNAWICGSVLLLLAAVTMRFPVLHPASGALGLWLIASSLLFESNGATVWNHTVMGLLIATASLLPLTGGTAGREPRQSRA
jgi:hypothetical protein